MLPASNREMDAPKRTRRRAAIPEDPRQRLLAVALDLFAHHSFEGVSTNRVTRAAGVSQPMIYHHFRPQGSALAGSHHRPHA